MCQNSCSILQRRSNLMPFKTWFLSSCVVDREILVASLTAFSNFICCTQSSRHQFFSHLVVLDRKSLMYSRTGYKTDLFYVSIIRIPSTRLKCSIFIQPNMLHRHNHDLSMLTVWHKKRNNHAEKISPYFQHKSRL